MPDWPQNRPSPFGKTENPKSLHSAWQFSATRISDLRRAIQSAKLPSHVTCIGLSGSLARMEAHSASDVDLLIVVDDRHDSHKTCFDETYSLVWEALDSHLGDRGLVRPKPGGVFSSCAKWSLLTSEHAKGIVNEDMTIYGQRMQLLLDCQPLFGDIMFERLQQELLRWYTEQRVADIFQEAGPYHWLWQEVQRYWRSIRARACWLNADDAAKLLEVNVKLRSSRLLLIVAFLLAIENIHRSSSAADQFVTSLKSTPLERLAERLEPSEFFHLVGAYEIAWTFSAQRPLPADLPASVLKALSTIKRVISNMPKTQTADWFV